MLRPESRNYSASHRSVEVSPASLQEMAADVNRQEAAGSSTCRLMMKARQGGRGAWKCSYLTFYLPPSPLPASQASL